MSALTGPAIEEQIQLGNIEVTPYEPALINPSSLDLRLGHQVIVYSRFANINEDGVTRLIPYLHTRAIIDTKAPEPTIERHVFDSETGFVLEPGVLYLMHTQEAVRARKHRPEVHGKSSIGRLGIFVHVTAGLGEPGFSGQYTLEVISTYPVRVYAGMRFCQISFETLEGDVVDYQQHGTYKAGEFSYGPVPSRIWKQFLK